MESIEIEDLLKLDSGAVTIVDIRADEDYRRGTIPHAIHIPKDEVCRRLRGHELSEPLYIMCHTGEREQGTCKRAGKRRISGHQCFRRLSGFFALSAQSFSGRKTGGGPKDLGD